MAAATVTASPRTPVRLPFIDVVCVWCGCFPCECPLAREERCACGGFIRAHRWEVLQAVVYHNSSLLHQTWRARNGL